MSYTPQSSYFPLDAMASGWPDASPSFDPLALDTFQSPSWLDPALILVDSTHRAKRVKLVDRNGVIWSRCADAGRPADKENLAFIFLRLAEVLGTDFYALVGHLPSDQGFVTLPFDGQLAVLCHTLQRVWTPPLLDLFAPFALTSLSLGPFHPWQDTGALLETFTNHANFAALTSFSIAGAFVSPAALLGIAKLRLEHLELISTSLDLAGVGCLALLAPTLAVLSLQGNAMIDDSALPFLSCFPNLLFLDLLGTFVTVPGLIKFLHRAPELQADLKNICPPIAVQKWLEAQGAVVQLSPDGKGVETPVEADRLATKAACHYNLALHLPADKLPSLSWGLQRLRNELKDVLQARLHQIRLLQYIHAPPSALRRTTSLPSLNEPDLIHLDLPSVPHDTRAATGIALFPGTASTAFASTPFASTSTHIASTSTSTVSTFACTIQGCGKSFGSAYHRDRHVKKVPHAAPGAAPGRGQSLSSDGVAVFGSARWST